MRIPPTRGTRARLAFVVALLFVATTPRLVGGQQNGGALDLLLPIGARATALGSAFVAEQGSEAVWWNPAGLSRMSKPELSLDHFETIFLKGDAVALIMPLRGIGTVGLSARLFNYGEQEQRDSSGRQTGTLLTRTVSVGATFSAPFGPNVDGGISFRLYRGGTDCVGRCTTNAFTTSYVDAGLQYRPFPARPLRLGIAIRNLGPSVQVVDDPQADALLARVHVGASYDPAFSGVPPDVRTRATIEIVASPKLQSPELRFGVQVGYTTSQSGVFARAGYVHNFDANAASTGPSAGIGLSQGRVQLDLTRIFETFSTGLGVAPTYISIRVGL